MPEPELIRLPEAARKLGCHVETLRERIRDGRLSAVRGPHGVYLVKPQDLDRQPRPVRGRPPKDWPVLSRADNERSWREAELELSADSNDIRIEVRLLKVLREDPDFAPELYRLVTVHRLRAIGWSFLPIADELEISERHARRLAKKRLWRSLHYLLAIRRARLSRKLTHRRAQELIEILRDRLNAENVPRGPWRWKRHKLNVYERQGLMHAGITEAELDAIWLKGLPYDQINYLLLKGFHGSTGRIAIRTKSEPLDSWARRRLGAL
jgi:AraC-like DNA-binding protein